MKIIRGGMTSTHMPRAGFTERFKACKQFREVIRIQSMGSDSTNSVLHRWKIVVDFVRDREVSDISLWGGNLTARMDGQIFSLAEAGALSKEAVSDMIRELLMINPE